MKKVRLTNCGGEAEAQWKVVEKGANALRRCDASNRVGCVQRIMGQSSDGREQK